MHPSFTLVSPLSGHVRLRICVSMYPRIYRSSSSGAITSPNFRLSFKFTDPNGQCSKSVHFIYSSIFSHSPPARTCFLFKSFIVFKKIQEDKWFLAFFFLFSTGFFKFGERRINFFTAKSIENKRELTDLLARLSYYAAMTQPSVSAMVD